MEATVEQPRHVAEENRSAGVPVPQHEDEEVELADVINKPTRHLKEVIQAECGLIQLEIPGLRTQIDTMSGLIDKLTEENRERQSRCRHHLLHQP